MAFMNGKLVCLLARIGYFFACLQFLGVQSQTQSTTHCSSIKHKEGAILEKTLSRLGPIMNKRFTITDTLYTYKIGICSTSTTNLGAAYDDAGVTQFNNTNIHSLTPITIGSFKETEVMSGTDWVMIEYEGGKKYGHHCGQEPRRANIMVICSPGVRNGVVRVIEESNAKSGDCFYLFEIEHECVCTSGKSMTVAIGGLSIGSVVCLVFFAIVGIYLATGFLYQRFVVGAKGFEQIPNLSFWQDFGNLQADGCNLVCRCGSRSNATKSYRGIGDDQLHTEEEDERDDNLLPM